MRGKHQRHPGLRWETEEQRAAEFEVAKILLQGHPAGTTLQAHQPLPYTNPETNRVETIELSYRFFIDGGGQVYTKATPAKDAKNETDSPGFLGESAFGAVFLDQNEEGNLFAAKMVTSPNEFRFAKEAGVAVSQYPVGRRVATIQHYLGTTLDKCNLEHADKLDLAEKMCDRVYKLHQKGIAHNDLNSGNITIDEFNDVHLIDFGGATPLSSLFYSDMSDASSLVEALTWKIGLTGEQLLGLRDSFAPKLKVADKPSVAKIYVKLLFLKYGLSTDIAWIENARCAEIMQSYMNAKNSPEDARRLIINFSEECEAERTTVLHLVEEMCNATNAAADRTQSDSATLLAELKRMGEQAGLLSNLNRDGSEPSIPKIYIKLLFFKQGVEVDISKVADVECAKMMLLYIKEKNNPNAVNNLLQECVAAQSNREAIENLHQLSQECEPWHSNPPDTSERNSRWDMFKNKLTELSLPQFVELINIRCIRTTDNDIAWKLCEKHLGDLNINQFISLIKQINFSDTQLMAIYSSIASGISSNKLDITIDRFLELLSQESLTAHHNIFTNAVTENAAQQNMSGTSAETQPPVAQEPSSPHGAGPVTQSAVNTEMQPHAPQQPTVVVAEQPNIACGIFQSNFLSKCAERNVNGIELLKNIPTLEEIARVANLPECSMGAGVTNLNPLPQIVRAVLREIYDIGNGPYAVDSIKTAIETKMEEQRAAEASTAHDTGFTP